MRGSIRMEDVRQTQFNSNATQPNDLPIDRCEQIFLVPKDTLKKVYAVPVSTAG